jgi:hypothetical protein
MIHWKSIERIELLKGIVSRDFVVCAEVPIHKERVHLRLKFRFRVKFFDFRLSA